MRISKAERAAAKRTEPQKQDHKDDGLDDLIEASDDYGSLDDSLASSNGSSDLDLDDL
jgi:hypothetical protein